MQISETRLECEFQGESDSEINIVLSYYNESKNCPYTLLSYFVKLNELKGDQTAKFLVQITRGSKQASKKWPGPRN